MFADVKILWVVEGAVKTVLNRVNHSWLQVNKQCTRYIVIIVSLVEKYVLAVFALTCILLECTIPTDAVFHAQLFPKLVTDCVKLGIVGHLLWLPHYPT